MRINDTYNFNNYFEVALLSCFHNVTFEIPAKSATLKLLFFSFLLTIFNFTNCKINFIHILFYRCRSK